jgi:hypothetical protein
MLPFKLKGAIDYSYRRPNLITLKHQREAKDGKTVYLKAPD